jgi:putative transcriptional regulator
MPTRKRHIGFCPYRTSHPFRQNPNGRFCQLTNENNSNTFYLEKRDMENIKPILAATFQTDMNRIKEVLEEKGIKQTWLAEQLGKSYNMVNGYVQNRQQPRLEVLFEIAKILDVEVADLLAEQKKKGK